MKLSKSYQNLLKHPHKTCIDHCFTKGLPRKLTFLSRTTLAILENLQETEKHIKSKLIPALTGKQETSDDERSSPLPVRDGGLTISLPEHLQEINGSREMASCLESDDLAAKLQKLL